MKANILKVLCNMSLICRYQIVLEDTSITIHKPVLWAIRISPVTPLCMSQSNMIKTQIALERCCSRYIQAYISFVGSNTRLRPFLLVSCHYQAFWVKNPLSPDKIKFLQFTGVYKKCSSRGINPSHPFANPFKNVGINMNRRCDLTADSLV